MGGHRHATDQKQMVLLAGCPAGCQTIRLICEGRDGPIDEQYERAKQTFGECTECGEPIGIVRETERREELE